MIMRNRLNLSPKAKTTVSVKRTLVYASVGAGLFVMLFTGAFFYLNMGNSEDVMAADPTTIRATVHNGEWNDPSTWTGNRVPTDKDVIEIPAGILVVIDHNENKALKKVTIKVFGIINFANGKLLLDS